MRNFFPILLLITVCFISQAQVCNTTDATACLCKDTSQVDCDLLPDLSISSKALTDSGGYWEYPQAGIPYEGAADGRLILTVAIPNIGNGPLEVRATNLF